MKSVLSRLSAFLADEGGQGTVEYLLILAVAVTGTVAFARAVVKTLDEGILSLGGQLEKDLKTGRTSVNAWIN
jgi:Flp pilus assembly pilin Flp